MSNSSFILHQEHNEQKPIIKIIGVGGAGGNAITHMIDSGLKNVTFIAANTDSQALHNTKAETLIQLGSELTKGLGAGADPDVGRNAAIEDQERIRDVLEGAHMVFITAGMGGGTGTGAAPVIAEVARELGILTVAVVSRPFKFEGRRRMNTANQGLLNLEQHVDSLITIPNERLISVLGKGASLMDSFKAANNVLFNAVQGITDSVMEKGYINLDFNDVKAVMGLRGLALMGVGVAQGDNRAAEATEAAISSPLLEDVDITGAQGLLVNVMGDQSISMGEFTEIGEIIAQYADPDANIIIGMNENGPEEGDIRVTIIATGLGSIADTLEAEMPQQPARRVKPVAPQAAPYTTAQAPVPPVAAPVEEVEENQAPPVAPKTSGHQDLFKEIMDVPSFLRKQSK